LYFMKKVKKYLWKSPLCLFLTQQHCKFWKSEKLDILPIFASQKIYLQGHSGYCPHRRQWRGLYPTHIWWEQLGVLYTSEAVLPESHAFCQNDNIERGKNNVMNFIIEVTFFGLIVFCIF
jgi:hypothetical protein